MTKVLDDGSLAITDLEITALQALLDSGDRGAFHYSYYKMSGTADALLTAKISTFSETVGGTAYASNWYLSELYGKNGSSLDIDASSYPGIYYLSQAVAVNILVEAKIDRDENEDGSGFLDNESHFNAAQDAWSVAENPEQFPGILIDSVNPFFDGGTGASFADFIFQPDSSPAFAASKFGIFYADATGKELSDFQGVPGYTIIKNGNASIVTDDDGRVVGVFNDFPLRSDAAAFTGNAASRVVNSALNGEEAIEQAMNGLISGDVTGRTEKDGASSQIIEARRGFDEFSETYNGDPDPELQFNYTDPTLSFRSEATSGDDILTSPDGGGTISAGTGNDLIFGDSGGIFFGGEDSIDGGIGDDIIWGYNGADILIGGEGNDVIRGGGGRDKIEGSEGSDVLAGGDSHDDILGGPDDDDGNDYLIGGNGADSLQGSGGNDTLLGGEGADVLSYISGTDILQGGAGNDYYDFTEATGSDAVIILEEGFGHDVFSSNIGAIDRVVFEGLASEDVTFTWDYSVQTFGGFITQQFYSGEASITVNETGESVYLANVSGQVDFDSFGLLSSYIVSYFALEFTDGVFGNWTSLFGRPDLLSSEAVSNDANTALTDHEEERLIDPERVVEEPDDELLRVIESNEGGPITETVTDVDDEFTWASYTSTYAADGATLTDQVYTYDDGRVLDRDYDETGTRSAQTMSDIDDAFSWTSYTQSYATDGTTLTDQVYTYDDGRVLDRDFDETGTRISQTVSDVDDASAWTSYTQDYANDGTTLVDHVYSYDDGRVLDRDFDENGVRTSQIVTDVEDAFAWTSSSHTYGSDGTTLIDQVYTYDDGRVLDRDYDESGVRSSQTLTDVDDAYAWTDHTRTYSEDGITLTDHVYNYDDGRVLDRDFDENGIRTSQTVSDVDDVFSWTDYTQTYATDGSTLTDHVYNYDNGRVLNRDFDENGVRTSQTMTDGNDLYPWTSYTQTFDEDGTLIDTEYVYDEEFV